MEDQSIRDENEIGEMSVRWGEVWRQRYWRKEIVEAYKKGERRDTFNIYKLSLYELSQLVGDLLRIDAGEDFDPAILKEELQRIGKDKVWEKLEAAAQAGKPEEVARMVLTALEVYPEEFRLDGEVRKDNYGRELFDEDRFVSLLATAHNQRYQHLGEESKANVKKIEELEERLKELRDKHTQSEDWKDKRKIREEDDKLSNEMKEYADKLFALAEQRDVELNKSVILISVSGRYLKEITSRQEFNQ